MLIVSTVRQKQKKTKNEEIIKKMKIPKILINGHWTSDTDKTINNL